MFYFLLLIKNSYNYTIEIESVKINNIDQLLNRSKEIYIGFSSELLSLTSQFKEEINLSSTRKIFFNNIYKVVKHQFVNQNEKAFLFCTVENLFSSFIKNYCYIFIIPDINRIHMMHVILVSGKNILNIQPIELY